MSDDVAPQRTPPPVCSINSRGGAVESIVAPRIPDMTTTPPSTPKPRRRWLQFSLRTLLVLMLVACVEWVGSRWKSAGLESGARPWKNRRTRWYRRLRLSENWITGVPPPIFPELRRRVPGAYGSANGCRRPVCNVKEVHLAWPSGHEHSYRQLLKLRGLKSLPLSDHAGHRCRAGATGNADAHLPELRDLDAGLEHFEDTDAGLGHPGLAATPTPNCGLCQRPRSRMLD